MSNDFFNASGTPAQGSTVDTPPVRAEFAAIAAGFDKMPGLTGNAYKIVYVNASGSKMDVVGGNGLLKLSTTGVPAMATDGVDYISPAGLHAGSAKTTPVDVDEMMVLDSAATYAAVKVTWANIKATLKTYFDGLYAAVAGSVSQAFAAASINLGHASDTTLERVSAGVMSVEGVTVAMLGTTQVWSKPQRPYYTNSDTASGGGSFSYDGSTKGQICLVTLTTAGAVTFGAPSNIVEGQPYTFILKAGDTNARTFAWNSAFKFASATSPLTSGTVTSGAYDMINFIGGASNTLIYNGHGADLR